MNKSWIVVKVTPMSCNCTTEVVAPLQSIVLEMCESGYHYVKVIGASGGPHKVEQQEYERIKKILIVS